MRKIIPHRDVVRIKLDNIFESLHAGHIQYNMLQI